jgi:predicted NBD/HSP70 family sugar kinase
MSGDGVGTPGLLVGVDVGGSKIAALVVDEAARVRGAFRTPSAIGAPDEAADAIVDAIDAALADAGARRDEVRAVGVGVPGRVDPATGTVTLAVNLTLTR